MDIFFTASVIGCVWQPLINEYEWWCLRIFGPKSRSLLLLFIIIIVKNLTYKDRLKRLKLSTLKYRRIRGDMIKVYMQGLD